MRYRSNGFGRVEQRIVIDVPIEFSVRVLQALGINSPEDCKEHGQTIQVVWRRWTTKLGDDETIVFELSSSLGSIFTHCKVNWDLSVWK